MRATPVSLLTGLVFGFVLATFQACPAVCSPATCATGCCDTAGRCQQSGNFTCGTNGGRCAACSVSESCVGGTCSPTGSGAGPAGGGGAGGGSAAGSYSAFLTSFANAYCQKAVQCGSLAASTQADCAALLVIVRGYGIGFGSSGSPSERSVARGASTYDAAQGQACLASVAALSCDRVGLSALLQACTRATTPAVAAGGACFGSADCSDRTLSCNGAACGRTCTPGGNLGEACKSDGTCNVPFLCRSGLCQPEPAPGTSCTSSFDCGSRAMCTNNRCATLPGPGQSCPSFQCLPEAYCDGTRVCRAKKMVGATCVSSSECETQRCAASVCAARLPAGSTCTGFNDCVSTAPCQNGRCTPPGTMGQPCDPQSFGNCERSLSCDDALRTCQPFTSVMTGQACSSTRSCAGGLNVCRNLVVVTDGGMSQAGTCGPAQVGDPCRGNSDCGVAQYCDMASRRCAAAGPASPCSSSNNFRTTDYCTSRNLCATRAAAGQVCDSAASSESCAAMGESCLPTATPGQSRCQRVPELGQPCFGTCVPFSACVNGTCVAAGRQGQPCVDSFPVGCVTGECLLADGGAKGFGDGDGTCQPPRANGQACSSDVGCQSGFCDRVATLFSSTLGVCTAACP